MVKPCAANPAKQRLRSASKGNFETMSSTKTFGDRAFTLAGPAEWNKLPDHIKNSATLAQFKTQLKTHIFAEVYD